MYFSIETQQMDCCLHTMFVHSSAREIVLYYHMHAVLCWLVSCVTGLHTYICPLQQGFIQMWYQHCTPIGCSEEAFTSDKRDNRMNNTLSLARAWIACFSSMTATVCNTVHVVNWTHLLVHNIKKGTELTHLTIATLLSAPATFRLPGC